MYIEPNGKFRPYKYIAFISYKHDPASMAVAKWLQSFIEHYTIPRHLRANPKIKHLGSVFRDTDELAAADDLSKKLKQSLNASKYLIVVCSSQTPHSKWVAEEIKYFLTTHPAGSVLTVLAEGNVERSIPMELKSIGRFMGSMAAKDPLAADFTDGSGHTSRKNWKKEGLRIVAALLGCSYNDLRRREKRYQIQKIAIASLSVLLVLLSAGIIYFNVHSRLTKQEQTSSQQTITSNISTASQNAEKGYLKESLIPLLDLDADNLKQEEKSTVQSLLTSLLDCYSQYSPYVAKEYVSSSSIVQTAFDPGQEILYQLDSNGTLSARCKNMQSSFSDSLSSQSTLAYLPDSGKILLSGKRDDGSLMTLCLQAQNSENWLKKGSWEPEWKEEGYVLGYNEVSGQIALIDESNTLSFYTLSGEKICSFEKPGFTQADAIKTENCTFSFSEDGSLFLASVFQSEQKDGKTTGYGITSRKFAIQKQKASDLAGITSASKPVLTNGFSSSNTPIVSLYTESSSSDTVETFLLDSEEAKSIGKNSSEKTFLSSESTLQNDSCLSLAINDVNLFACGNTIWIVSEKDGTQTRKNTDAALLSMTCYDKDANIVQLILEDGTIALCQIKDGSLQVKDSRTIYEGMSLCAACGSSSSQSSYALLLHDDKKTSSIVRFETGPFGDESQNLLYAGSSQYFLIENEDGRSVASSSGTVTKLDSAADTWENPQISSKKKLVYFSSPLYSVDINSGEIRDTFYEGKTKCTRQSDGSLLYVWLNSESDMVYYSDKDSGISNPCKLNTPLANWLSQQSAQSGKDLQSVFLENVRVLENGLILFQIPLEGDVAGYQAVIFDSKKGGDWKSLSAEHSSSYFPGWDNKTMVVITDGSAQLYATDSDKKTFTKTGKASEAKDFAGGYAISEDCILLYDSQNSLFLWNPSSQQVKALEDAQNIDSISSPGVWSNSSSILFASCPDNSSKAGTGFLIDRQSQQVVSVIENLNGYDPEDKKLVTYSSFPYSSTLESHTLYSLDELMAQAQKRIRSRS